MSSYVRMVETEFGAMAAQIVCAARRGWLDIERLGSAHEDAGLELLKAGRSAGSPIPAVA